MADNAGDTRSRRGDRAAEAPPFYIKSALYEDMVGNYKATKITSDYFRYDHDANDCIYATRKRSGWEFVRITRIKIRNVVVR